MHTDDASSAFATPEAKHDMNHPVVHAESGAGRSFSDPQKNALRCKWSMYAQMDCMRASVSKLGLKRWTRAYLVRAT